MIATRTRTLTTTTTQPAEAAPVTLEEYYSEAGPDYAAWSREFNMHFGYWRPWMNPFRREAMLEQMNREVLERLQVSAFAAPKLLDLGCGLGATMRSIARRMPNAQLVGLTKVPWQVEQANALHRAAGCADRARVLDGDYQDSALPRGAYHGVYALESSCHADGPAKAALLKEAHRLLRRGGRIVIADGFLTTPRCRTTLQQRIYRKLCECWVIDELAQLDAFVAELGNLGFKDICVERLQCRVAPSVLHIPWVTLKFLVGSVLFGEKRMTRARWNNVIAPVILPLVGAPLVQ